MRNVIEQLRESGEVVRGWLGVSIQDVDKDLAESFGLDRPRGALIAQVGVGSPAEKSGLESGDIILEFAGQPINNSADLPHVVGLIAPETTVQVLIRRDGKDRRLDVTVGGLDADQRPTVAATDGERQGALLGLVLETAEDAMMAEMGLPGGVVVLEVRPNSPAEDGGIAGGDVITRLGSKAIQIARGL